MTPSEILLTTLVIVIFCLGIRQLMCEGMLFYSIRKPFENKKRPPTILKPIILCVVCFASVWGSIAFIALHGLQWEMLICLVSATFIIRVINDKIDW